VKGCKAEGSENQYKPPQSQKLQTDVNLKPSNAFVSSISSKSFTKKQRFTRIKTYCAVQRPSWAFWAVSGGYSGASNMLHLFGNLNICFSEIAFLESETTLICM